MPWQIQINSKEDLEFMKSLFEGSVHKIKSGSSKFGDEAAQRILTLYEAIDGARQVEGQVQSGEEDDREPAKRKSGVKTEGKRSRASTKKPEKGYQPRLCSAHPGNTFQRPPRTNCDGCWEAYKKLNPLKYDVARRDFERRQRKEVAAK